MGKRGRGRFSASEKVSILKRHLVGKEEVSAVCEELRLHPINFMTGRSSSLRTA
jgi:transposase-like protein